MKGRIGIVGGSIAGCAAALGATRAGYDVTLFERATDLRDRGFGVGMPKAAYEELTAAGYLDAALPVHPVTHRLWIVAEPGEPTGRVLWRQPIPAMATSWGRLWGALADRAVPHYRAGTRVTAVSADGAVTTEDGLTHAFDLVIGADGHHSRTRSVIDPGPPAREAGYSLWRGTIPQERLPRSLRPIVESSFVTGVFDGGHAVFYLIPSDTGGRRLMWAVYGCPPGADPAGEPWATIERVLPPAWAEACRESETPVVHPVTDRAAATYAADRVLLIGDAATLARPHTASGAVKAMLDAACIERLLAAGTDLREVPVRYDAERRPAGNQLVEIGRRLGGAMVDRTPPWGSMTPEDLSDWTASVLRGDSHYLYSPGPPDPVN
ncbi:2-polyprenyl-6-methoxyphenol hydroxylase-like FAD-dependent oxidoreductase [Allocatelliglobosispora scoriae]|uniref:2-polyprenyl-6-methoxyphenol hydroxylase-like FAD-dependent oxidoreductase n=1 Tax=Allocatelliglobosispora scoriae TaxID=643052 RepID=A0A841BJX7_9ACTN|nr:FAD-dependent monooxygenase [Allocatelliglobosispora scoriae]MBB5867323.1 2-polyprenyl-6-methoxyphenol hydroxylase-like FAD-dependent oxidoreductase [Allocatelliglobosispora scoriae]